MSPALLDLFCGAGGAAVGYWLAGFNVVGVDVKRQPRYPFPFVQADALDYLAEHARSFQAVHASPPCKVHTALRPFAAGHHADLVPATRSALVASGHPWVIENVPYAPLVNPVVLCGSMFALGASCDDGRWRYLQRHRLFETDWPLVAPEHPEHPEHPAIGVYGHGHNARLKRQYNANRDEGRAALGAGWMSQRELSQAIPPAYTEHIGAQLMAVVA